MRGKKMTEEEEGGIEMKEILMDGRWKGGRRHLATPLGNFFPSFNVGSLGDFSSNVFIVLW